MNYNTECFIVKATEKHADRYDYSKVIYTTAKSKVIIICKKHGEFLQTPNNHMYNGCPKCGKIKQSESKKLTQTEFIDRASKIHKSFYDYSKVIYKNSKENVIIICPKHGAFTQNAGNHLCGCDCPKCAIEKQTNNLKLGTDKFIKRAKQIHGEKYDYSKIIYQNKDKYVTIICRKHGEFYQSPHNHCRNKAGCPKCKESKGELKIRHYLETNKIQFTSQQKFDSCRYKNCLSFDFAVWENEKVKLIIEYNGLQHYKPSGFGSDSNEKLQRTIRNDLIKENWCKNNNIPLLVISYEQFDDIEMILKQNL